MNRLISLTIIATLILGTISTPVFSEEHLMDFEYTWEGFTNLGSSTPDKLFYRTTDNTSSGNTGPYRGAENSLYYLFLETSYGGAYSAGQSAIIQQATTANEMSFYYHMYGADTGTLKVQVNGNTIWQISGQQHSSHGAEWMQKTLNLSRYSGTKTVRLVGVASGGYRGDIGIDQIRFDAIPSSTMTYQYDALGRLVCVTDAVSGDRSYDYDDAGNRNEVLAGNAATSQGNCD